MTKKVPKKAPKADADPPARQRRTARTARLLEPLQLTDPKAMRALAHPVRVALLEAMGRDGQLTATEAAELVDESPANCSFHLRTLAKYGFVEEGEGGDGRSRPWRRVSIGLALELDQDNPDATVAAYALASASHQRSFEKLQEFQELRDIYPKTLAKAAFSRNGTTYATAAELVALEEAVAALLAPYRERTIDPAQRPDGAVPIAYMAFAHPVPPLPSGN